MGKAYRERPRYPDYMGWISKQRCFCCGARKNIEVAHVGDRGFGQKCSDMETLPACVECHRTGKRSLHQAGKNFWIFYGLDKGSLIKQYQERYLKETNAVIEQAGIQ